MTPKKKKVAETVSNWFDDSDAVKTRYLETAQFDCSFKVGSDKCVKILKSYRVILVTVSPVFQRLFAWQLTTDDRAISIVDADPNVFEKFLYAILYPNDVLMYPMDTLIGLLELAKRYVIGQLYEKFENRIVDELNDETVIAKDVLKCFTFAHRTGIRELITLCTENINKKLSTVDFELFMYDVDPTVFYELLKILKGTIVDNQLFSHIELYARINKLERTSTLEELTQKNTGQTISLDMMLALVDFKEMGMCEFGRGPANSKILSADEKLEIFIYYSEK